MPASEARKFFVERSEPYKAEIIDDLGQDVKTVTLYRQGGFTDLCRGPHVPSSGVIRAFKLLSVAGAYWRGDERNKMLQRIYGTAFADEKQLKDHLAFLEEARRRDHRSWAGNWSCSCSPTMWAGHGHIHAQGGRLRTILEDFEKRLHFKRGYDIVYGPSILRGRMWETSGHMDNYRENMYFTEVDGQLYGIKPMNCLSHIMIYKSKVRSYRDLPLRLFELGNVTRHEKSG